MLNNKRIAVRLTQEQRNKLDQIAVEEDTNLSVIIRLAITDFIVNWEIEKV